jgi:hypothetical protein
VVYKHLDKLQYGVIHQIFYVEQQNRYLLKIQPLENTNYDSLTIGSKVFTNEHIIFGGLSKQKVHFVSAADILEKACCYKGDATCYFARYPNFYESS